MFFRFLQSMRLLFCLYLKEKVVKYTHFLSCRNSKQGSIQSHVISVNTPELSVQCHLISREGFNILLSALKHFLTIKDTLVNRLMHFGAIWGANLHVPFLNAFTFLQGSLHVDFQEPKVAIFRQKLNPAKLSQKATSIDSMNATQKRYCRSSTRWKVGGLIPSYSKCMLKYH